MEQRELLEQTRRTNDLLRKELLWTRVAAALLAVLLLLMLYALAGIGRGITQISWTISQIDLTAVTEQLERIDIEAFNETLHTLEGKLGEIDIQAFNNAVSHLNEAVGSLQEASDTVKGWSDSFSRGLTGLFGS